MATARSRKPKPGAVRLQTFIVEDAEPGVAPFAGLGRAAPWPKQLEGPALALEQMRLTIEDNLLMVFGPEGDPVPPQAFTAAAAAHPDTLLDLPDGTTAPASRIAAVLHAQVLGRLGRSMQGSAWIQAMLRESGRPEPASEDQLRAEQDAQGALGALESRLTGTADAGGIAAGAAPGSDDQATSCNGEQIAGTEADAALATPQDEKAAAREALDQASPEQAAASIGPSHEPAVLRLELDPEKRASNDMPRAVRSAQADAKKDAKAVAKRTDVDPDGMGLVARRSPEGGRLSTGVDDDDGSWFRSLRNLSARTITPGSRPGSRRGGARGVTADLRTRTVPLADHRRERGAGERDAGGPDKGEPGFLQESGAGAADRVAPGSRTVALGMNPQAWAGEGYHALVLRDVPAGARLSAGAYDPALDGWVMRPQDLGGLTISAPPELRGDFTVTLMGIALRPGDADAVRILAWLPVKIA